VELGLTPDTRRAVETVPMIAAARAAGFTALGMVSGRFPADTRIVMQDNGLRCHELLGLQITRDTDATIAMARRLAADAAALEASWVLTTFDVGLDADVEELVARCAAIVADAGAGAGRVGVVIDSWSFCFGGATWDDLERLPLDEIAYVQFADALAPLGTPNLEEAMTRRALPGEGVLALDRFVSTLRNRGWDGVVSMQVLSDVLRALPFEEYAWRVHDAAGRYWD
jgi:sugar phosphate isomerase/epimerase